MGQAPRLDFGEGVVGRILSRCTRHDWSGNGDGGARTRREPESSLRAPESEHPSLSASYLGARGPAAAVHAIPEIGQEGVIGVAIRARVWRSDDDRPPV